MKTGVVARRITRPEELGLFVAPRNEREYDAAVAQLGELMDEIGDNPRDRPYRLIETLSALIEAYDREHYPAHDVSSIDMLRFLMEQHKLTQRELNTKQLLALAKRFGVPPAAFLPDRA